MRMDKAMNAIDPVVAGARAEGLLILGFNAWIVAPDGMNTPDVRETIVPVRTRALWADQRVTTTELESSEAALHSLALELDANQLSELPLGPTDLGNVSFVHPDRVAPAVFFVRANVLVTITSRNTDVLPLAYRIDAELRARPQDNVREGGIDLQVQPDAKQTTISIKPQWRFDEGYVKVIAKGVALAKAGKEVVAEGKGPIEVFVVEKGRETYLATAALGTL